MRLLRSKLIFVNGISYWCGYKSIECITEISNVLGSSSVVICFVFWFGFSSFWGWEPNLDGALGDVFVFVSYVRDS